MKGLVYTLNGWQSVPCATDAFIDAHFGHPRGQTGLLSKDPAGGSLPLVYGQLEMTFPQVGTEIDTFVPGVPNVCPAPGANRANVLSVQNNTNQFKAANGDNSFVQFAIQSDGKTNGICIWNVNLATQKYPKTCYSPPNPPVLQRTGGLIAFDTANIAAYVDTTTNFIKMVVGVSWVQPDQPTMYAISEPDTIGLANNWFQVSGSVLGGGNCSQAVFTNTELLTRLAASSCAGDTSADGPTCSGNTLSPNVQLANGSVTVETNNLVNVAAPALSFPNSDLVFVNYMSTTSGSCLGPSVVYVKDRSDDNGAQPSNASGQPFWESPDIFLVPSGAPVDPQATATETLVTPGASYDVYVRVHNDLGCSPITGVKALVYLADPSALSTEWKPITGSQYVGGASPNGVSVATGMDGLIGPLTFVAPASGFGDGHECIIAAIEADGEPAVASNFDAPASNQVAQKNVQVSDCKFPLTNATTSTGQVQITLSVSPLTTTPTLTGTTDVEVTFDDPDQSWQTVWAAQPGVGTNFNVTHSGTSTIVRLGMSSITLNSVPLASGETRTATGALGLPPGGPTASLALQATLNEGGVTVVTNGGTCQVTPSGIIQ